MNMLCFGDLDVGYGIFGGISLGLGILGFSGLGLGLFVFMYMKYLLQGT